MLALLASTIKEKFFASYRVTNELAKLEDTTVNTFEFL
jgi:hypothetical protein